MTAALSVVSRPSYTATRHNEQITNTSFAFTALFCYSGWSQIVVHHTFFLARATNQCIRGFAVMLTYLLTLF